MSVLDRVFRPQRPLNHLNHLHRPITHTHARPKSPARTSQPNPRVKPPTSIMNTPSTLISTPSALASLLTTLTFALPPNPSTPSLYIDLEGVNLCRHGTISLLTVYVLPLGHVYLIDVHTLASLAFTTPCPCTGATLGSLLASPTVPKAFFDVRNDSDALFAHYGVRLAAVEDVQLMENAGRTGRHRLSGLERCVESHLGPGTGTGLLSEKEHSAWCAVKDEGKKLFAPELGGGYEVFEERPMRPEVERYCVNDGMYMLYSLPCS